MGVSVGKVSFTVGATTTGDVTHGTEPRTLGGFASGRVARIAGVWNAWLGVRRDAAAPLDAHDVGVMMALMKLARTQSGSFNLDDYIDACGYAACAGEVGQSKL